uniref:Uncharacterized protein n=1 Tax=Rhizophora mucronata TaxID=61149 RepID=A0A2P2IQY0_RHIMU
MRDAGKGCRTNWFSGERGHRGFLCSRYHCSSEFPFLCLSKNSTKFVSFNSTFNSVKRRE